MTVAICPCTAKSNYKLTKAADFYLLLFLFNNLSKNNKKHLIFNKTSDIISVTSKNGEAAEE